MRTHTFSNRRSSLPLLLGVTMLAACDTANTPEPVAALRAASTANAMKGGNGTGMVPFTDSASIHKAPDAVPITCAPTINNAVHTVGANKYVGRGPGSHLGMSAVTITFALCRTIDLPSGGEFVVWAAEGPFTLEAANGEELDGYFYMTQFLSGNFRLDSANFTGGTGRFANASGQAKGNGFINRPTLDGWYRMSGLLTKPNS